MKGQSLLELEDISKVFGTAGSDQRVVALDQISLSINVGEFVTVIGPSGCGKSSLMDLVAGLDKPTSGRILMDGTAVTKPRPDIAVVFQQDATFPWLTNLRNVEYGLRSSGLSKKDRSARALEALELVGLAGFAKHHPTQLSGGMRQRVNIARALAGRPRVLLMDEPFGALDEQTRLRLQDELLTIWRETGSTILFITHGLSEAALLSTRILVMSARPGRIIDDIASPLPWDRTSDEIGSPVFGELSRHLWNELSGADKDPSR